jgi:lysophospholipase L1-like esterase
LTEQTELNICLLGDGFVKGIGDPNMRGWAGQLVLQTANELGPLTFYNLGIPGDTSEMVAGRLRELVPRLPKGNDNRLIICFGLSDTEQVDGKVRVSNQESVEALKQLILKTRSHCKLLMIGLPPVYDPQRNNRIRRLNSLYRELCQKAHVPFVDIYPALSEDVQYKRDLAKSDKVYPSELGYQKIFDLIWNDRSWWFN